MYAVRLLMFHSDGFTNQAAIPIAMREPEVAASLCFTCI